MQSNDKISSWNREVDAYEVNKPYDKLKVETCVRLKLGKYHWRPLVLDLIEDFEFVRVQLLCWDKSISFKFWKYTLLDMKVKMEGVKTRDKFLINLIPHNSLQLWDLVLKILPSRS